MAHVTGLAAARHAVLEQHGWDVRERGLAASPPISVVVGRLRHVTVDRALRLLGIGASQLVVVPTDSQGRMQPDGLQAALTGVDGPIIVCAQAGEVNTGSFDPLPEIVEIVRTTDAWLHVDGAFGLWAAASATRRPSRRGNRSCRLVGRLTRTSGSTSRTTAGSRSVRSHPRTSRR